MAEPPNPNANLTGKTPGAPDNTFKWLLHAAGEGPLAAVTPAHEVHLGDGTPTGVRLSQQVFGIPKVLMFSGGTEGFSGAMALGAVGADDPQTPPGMAVTFTGGDFEGLFILSPSERQIHIYNPDAPPEHVRTTWTLPEGGGGLMSGLSGAADPNGVFSGIFISGVDSPAEMNGILPVRGMFHGRPYYASNPAATPDDIYSGDGVICYAFEGGGVNLVNRLSGDDGTAFYSESDYDSPLSVPPWGWHSTGIASGSPVISRHYDPAPVSAPVGCVYVRHDGAGGLVGVWYCVADGVWEQLPPPPDMTKFERVLRTVELSDAAAITWDTTRGHLASVTLGGNRTLANLSNTQPGTYILRVRQDATGGRELAFGSLFRFPGGQAPALSAAPGAVDVLTIVRFAGDDFLYVAEVRNFQPAS